MKESLNSSGADSEPLLADPPILLTESERHKLLVEWNATAADYPRDKCIHELFEAQAERTPGAVALVFEEQPLAYRGLNERANQLAHRLRELGVGPESLVGVHVDRSVEYVVSVLGILKAGGAYLPLDTDYPVPRLQFMLADADVKLVITDQPLPAALELRGITRLDLVAEAPLMQSQATHNPSQDKNASQPAYVIYTSGSTGQPKGVIVPHRGVVRLVRGQSYATFNAPERFLLLASTSFDATTFELWGPLLNGGACVVFPKQLPDFEQLEAVVRRQEVTCLWLTAGLFNQIIDGRPSVLATLRQVLTGGEALSVPHVQKAMKLLPALRLTNGYGPTESTTFACCHDLTPEMTFPTGSVPIGRPIANTQCYVLDQWLQPVPVGVAGELHIGGDGLACGYLNRPELTAEKFIANPFSQESGSRLYKTGDLCRYQPDGTIEFLGRLDNQVKIRGYRIETGEIEAVLVTHPKLLSAVVIAREDVPGNKQLVAYLIPRREAAPTVAELREHLLKQLPDYMVPAAFVLLEQLPLTANGKVDRKALPAPEASRLEAGAGFVAPRTPTEQALAKIWSELLGVERLGIHDNFFALGGHSLMAVRMTFRIRDTLQVDLSAMVISQCPTIAELSLAVDEVRKKGDSPIAIRPVRLPRPGTGLPVRFPVSFNQQQLWFIDQLESGRSVYNLPFALRLRGRLDRVALQRSLNYLIQRHEVLRTTFTDENGEPMQVVLPEVVLELPAVELQNLPADQREAEAQRLMLNETGRSFDLTQGPLVRAELLSLNQDNHILLVTIHHIVFDGWSVDVLLRELAAGYAAFCGGQPPVLPELPVQYADYAAWQRQYLTAERVVVHLDFWRKQLAGVPAMLELPTDRPHTAIQRGQGAEHHFKLAAGTVKMLRQLGQNNDATLFVTVLAAFHVLLHRYSRQEQILIGTPFAGRTGSEVEDLIGYFVNALPVKADFATNPKFDELLRQVRDTVWAVQAHQELPFEQLVRDLQPVREPNCNPLFQVCAVHEVMPSELCPLADLTVEFKELVPPEAMFDLIFAVTEQKEDLEIALRFNADLFDDATILRLIESFQTLCAGIVANPRQRVSEIPLLAESERYKLLVEWNNTAVAYPPGQCLHQLFEVQVAKTPEAVALSFESQRLTYRELNERANRLAHHLQKLGVGPEMLVGLYVERSVEMVIGLLGILKAGGAYVPMDPIYPQERLAFMLEDAKSSVVVTQKKLTAMLLDVAAKIVCLDSDWSAISIEPNTNPVSDIRPNHLAYVIYTSGSTGKPKGSLISHYNVVRLFQATEAWFDFTQKDVWTLFHSSAFDFSVWEIWGAILYGGRLVVVPFSVSRSPDAFYRLLCEEDVTVLNQTPAAFRQLIRVEEEGDWAGLKSGPSLRLVIFGGEALGFQSLKPWFDRHGDQHPRLVNMYGITETTVHVTYRPIFKADLTGGSVIGRPIPDLQVYLLDEQKQLLPIGVPGEIFVGGAGVGRGYLNRPDLTSQKFISDPFKPGAGNLLYRSGDLGRFLPNGDIEYLGRIDQQVKIRGFRIELGEIETVLSGHPAVRDCAMVARDNAVGEKMLVAYLVVREEPAPTVTELREFLLKKLPDYMVPAAFVNVEKLPLTTNGKIDRKALPAPNESRLETGIQFVAPRTPTEAAMAKIWSELLGVGRIGIHDNFFALGGHSLLAVGMLERLRQVGMHADVRTLFAKPTLVALAAVVRRESGSVEVPPNLIPPQCDAITPEMLPLVQLTSVEIERIACAVPGGAANIQDIYPLAPLQEGILFHHRMSTEGDPYVVSAMLGFDSRARLQQYLQALQAVIDRNDILRTAAFWEGLSEPVQVVWRKAPLVVEEVSFPATAGDVTGQLHARFNPRHYRLDVRQAPQMRLFIAQDAANARWVMLQMFHHFSDDHTTQEVVEQEIQAHLLGQVDALPTPLPFRNFIAKVRQGLSKEEHEAFFQKMLGDVDEPTIPFGLADTHGDGSGIVEARYRVDAALAQRLRDRARDLGVSAASVCHLAWAQVLARVSIQDDVVFGTVLFGRLQGGSGVDRMMGIMINTLPIRIRVSDETVRDSVRHTHALLAELLYHEHAPLQLAQRCSAVAAPAPLFSALLNYRHIAAGAQERAQVAQSHEGVVFLGSEERTNFPLTLSVDDLGDGFELTAKVLAPIEPQRVCAFMNRALERLVGSLESAPTMPLRSLDVLPESERDQLLVGWNHTTANYPKGGSIHELFEAQAAKSPEAISVTCGDEHLTYRELNERANQLASYLHGQGVKSDQLVGICLERSLDMVVALLGVLKAGGAFVPLDPAYPACRLVGMLQDSQVSVLITQSSLLNLCNELKRVPDLNEGGRVCQIICLDDKEFQLVSREKTNPKRSATSRDLAYVIFTSGSTGKPKGVQIEHRSVVNHLQWRQRTFPIGSEDRFLQKANLNFDIAIWEIFTPLLFGAQLILAKPEGQKDPAYLVHLMAQHKVTLAHFGPALLQMVVDEPAFPKCTSLRQVFCGGEPLPGELQKRFFARTRSELISQYGPTETTIDVTWCQCERADVKNPAPIGRPIANTQCYVLDRHLQLLPIGVAGELHIGGDGLARGYLNRPDLTAEKFVANPFSQEPGSRLYKTGDLCRYLPDGNIEFLGRLDNQVKIRGYRIEIGEIEAVLASHPHFLNAVVIAREGISGDKQLVAYLVSRAGTAPTVADLREYLFNQLPEYMVPAVFVNLEKLPLTPNGKIDRKVLPAPDENRLVSGTEFVAPRTPTEQALVKIWSELLGAERIGVYDDFFALGGHSLLAVRMVDEINRQLRLELPLRTMFQHPTIHGLAALLQTQTNQERRPELVQLNAGRSGPELFFLIDEGSLGLFKLAHHLDKDQSLFASVVPLSEATLKAAARKQLADLPRMEDWAAEHVKLIRSRQATGPVLLVGHCFGGKLAFEVARQLQAAGIPVKAVLMMDTWMANTSFWWQQKAWLEEHLGKLFCEGPKYLWQKSTRRVRIEKKELTSRINLALSHDFNLHVPWVIVSRIYLHAMRGYQLQRLTTRGVLFLSQDDWMANAYRRQDDTLGARPFFDGGVEVVNVPGNHVTILDEEHLPELARRFNQYLKQLRGA